MSSGQGQAGWVDVELTPTPELDAAAWREMEELQLQVHGPVETRRDAGTRLTWSGGDDSVCVVRVREQGVLVTSLHVSQRISLAYSHDNAQDGERGLHAGGREVLVGGIRGVLTHTEFRRRGFAGAAMRRAMGFMLDELRVELGLLFSSKMGRPLYAGLGWEVFSGPVWCEQPSRPINREQPAGRINYTQLMPDDPPMLLRVPGNRLSAQAIDSIDIRGLPW